MFYIWLLPWLLNLVAALFHRSTSRDQRDDKQQPEFPWRAKQPWDGEGDPCGHSAIDLHAERNGVAWFSSSPQGWLHEQNPGQAAYYQLHIPKTAGTSFSLDAAKFLKDGVGLFAKEGCYTAMSRQLGSGDGLVTMLRNPVTHIYSQYLMCAYSCWGRRETAGHREHFANFSTWLDHFAGQDSPASDIGCYHPQNLQVRALTCSPGQVNAAHHLLEPVGTLNMAVANMESMFFVGLSELYQESMCVFLIMANGEVPDFCNCENAEAWGSFQGTHDDHKLPEHDVNHDIYASDLAAIEKIAAVDKQAYSNGVRLFFSRLRKVEGEHNVNILCKDDKRTEALLIAAR